MSQQKSGSDSVLQFLQRKAPVICEQAECDRCSTAVVLTDGNLEVVSFPRYRKDSKLFFDRMMNASRVSVPATLCVVDKALNLTAYYLLLFRCQHFLDC